MKVESLIKPIILGKIGSCYGIRGWMRISSFTEREEGIFFYQPWFIKNINQWKKVEFENWKYHNQEIIFKLKHINSREEAISLTNFKIFIDSSQLSVLEKGNYYWNDLIGCRIFTTKGYDLGKVIYIMKTGSNDVLVIKANLQDNFNIKERLIPFLENQVIKKVNLLAQTIEVDWEPNF